MLSVKEFCKLAGISRSGYYVLKAKGENPAEIEIGNRRVIDPDTAKMWLKSREVAPTSARTAG